MLEEMYPPRANNEVSTCGDVNSICVDLIIREDKLNNAPLLRSLRPC